MIVKFDNPNPTEAERKRYITMIKKAIKIKNSNLDAIFIFFALPTEMQENTVFQWYIARNKTDVGIPIENQFYASYPIDTKQVEKNGYFGKYLYCKYNINKTGNAETERIQLFSNVTAMIDAGVIFDDISATDEAGNLISLE